MKHDVALHPYDLIIPVWGFAAILAVGYLTLAWRMRGSSQWLTGLAVLCVPATLINAGALQGMNAEIGRAATDINQSILQMPLDFVLLAGAMLIPPFVGIVYTIKRSSKSAVYGEAMLYGWITMFLAAATLFGHSYLYYSNEGWWVLVGGLSQFVTPAFGAVSICLFVLAWWDQKATRKTRAQLSHTAH